jgi:hypothetical protein
MTRTTIILIPILLTGCSAPATMTQAALQGFPVLFCLMLFVIGGLLIKDKPWAPYAFGVLIGIVIIGSALLLVMAKAIQEGG